MADPVTATAIAASAASAASGVAATGARIQGARAQASADRRNARNADLRAAQASAASAAELDESLAAVEAMMASRGRSEGTTTSRAINRQTRRRGLTNEQIELLGLNMQAGEFRRRARAASSTIPFLALSGATGIARDAFSAIGATR